MERIVRGSPLDDVGKLFVCGSYLCWRGSSCGKVLGSTGSFPPLSNRSSVSVSVWMKIGLALIRTASRDAFGRQSESEFCKARHPWAFWKTKRGRIH